MLFSLTLDMLFHGMSIPILFWILVISPQDGLRVCGEITSLRIELIGVPHSLINTILHYTVIAHFVGLIIRRF